MSWLPDIPTWGWILIIIYLLYVIFFLMMFYKVISSYIPTYRKLPKDVREKYFMFIRPEVDNINPFSMFICGLTLAPIRFIVWVLALIMTNLLLHMVWCCSDRNKPLSKGRRCLSKFISAVG